MRTVGWPPAWVVEGVTENRDTVAVALADSALARAVVRIAAARRHAATRAFIQRRLLSRFAAIGITLLPLGIVWG
jgi:hypothetical protein